jgi:hypothetical protein
MICPECHGSGKRAPANTTDASLPAGGDALPCPECGGCGIVHCCEGERPDGTAGAAAAVVCLPPDTPAAGINPARRRR